ncbi:MAG TPA: hypothetical protein VK539_10455 [Myxococcaceae bacterium]|nr:hypothetical protein [Myxococcaceae bacterium]
MMDALLDITQMTAGRLFDRFERVRLDRKVTGYGVGLCRAAFHSPPVSPPLTR